MANKDGAETTADIEPQILIADEEELTPKELAQERKAAQEERQRLHWLAHTPAELAGRIPVSVFAMGDLVSGA